MTAYQCSCGGWIRATAGREANAVRVHQLTQQHQEWRWPHMLLGPCPCSRCGELLGWNGSAWREAHDVRHDCVAA